MNVSEPMIDETIESIATLERQALEAASHHQRRIERITFAVGRPAALYLAVGLIAGWVVVNLVAAALKHPLDTPPFPLLSTTVTCTSVLLTIMVLVAANRGDELDEQRDRLHLQIALVTERKTAKLIALIEELRRDLPDVRDRHDAEAVALALPADPHAVSEELQKRTPGIDEGIG